MVKGLVSSGGRRAECRGRSFSWAAVHPHFHYKVDLTKTIRGRSIKELYSGSYFTTLNFFLFFLESWASRPFSKAPFRFVGGLKCYTVSVATFVVLFPWNQTM